MDPFVSIVVPTFNRRGPVHRLLRALTHQTYPPAAFEVLVVDTGSTDGTREMAASFTAPYRLTHVPLEKRHLFDAPIARNVGTRLASGQIVLYVDSDMLLGPDFVEEHVGCHRAVPSACVCGACVHLLGDGAGDRLVEGAINPDEVAAQLAPYQAGMVECSGNLPGCRYPWSYCYGGNFSVPRTLLAAVGGWDEQFVHGMLAVDTHLGYRLHRQGARMIFTRYGASYHELGTFSEGDQARRSERVSAGLRYTERHYDDPQLRAYIAFRERYESRLRQLSACARARTFPCCDDEDREGWVDQVLPAARPRLSVLVLTRGADQLDPVLRAFDDQTAPPSDYELLVYDLAAPDGIGGRRPPAAADLTVQARSRPYVVRYYAAGPSERLSRLISVLTQRGAGTDLEATLARALSLATRLQQPRHMSVLQSPHLPLLLSRVSLYTSFLHNSSLASRARGAYLHLLDPAQAIGPTFVRDRLLEVPQASGAALQGRA